MQEERKEALGVMAFSLLWVLVSVVLFLFQAHYRVDDLIDGIFGKGTVASLIKIPVSLLWILVYFGGFFGFFMGAKQLVTGKKAESQRDPGETKEERPTIQWSAHGNEAGVRRPIWFGILPLILATVFLVTGLTVSPKERDGVLIMSRGHGVRLTPEQNAEFLEKLRREGFNVPTSMIEQARQQRASAGNRALLAKVMYILAAISFVAGGIGFLFTGGFGFLKKLLTGSLLGVLAVCVTATMPSAATEAQKKQSLSAFDPRKALIGHWARPGADYYFGANTLHQVDTKTNTATELTYAILQSDRKARSLKIRRASGGHQLSGDWLITFSPDSQEIDVSFEAKALGLKFSFKAQRVGSEERPER
ncbi:MAG: hypothetical protein HY695_24780 [Deltaproteobacteria bacterium]|nr:hypothetical protein [Deltaproteobacteria bacterium]